MKLNARHLTVDLYNCKNSQLTDIELIKETLKKSLSLYGTSLISLCCEKVEEDHHALMGIPISKAMRSFFKPDKTKTTLLKRGDFTSAKEIKPKVKTHVAPLRKIHNTGAKVIRILARRNNK